MASAFRTEPWASEMDTRSPKTRSEKYSAAPNFKAMRASGGAAMASTSVATEPAKKEPSAAVASAGPALPLRAIW